MTKYAYNYATTEDLEELKKNMPSGVKLYRHNLNIGNYILNAVSVLKDSFAGKKLYEIRELCTYFSCSGSRYGTGDLIDLNGVYYLIQRDNEGIITLAEIARGDVSIVKDHVAEDTL